VVVASPVVEAFSKVRVALSARRARGGQTRLHGFVSPAAPAGRALLQRRARGGRWALVRRGALKPFIDHRSRYRFMLPARRRGERYRVVVVPDDGGAHVQGTSRRVFVGGVRRR